MIRATVGILASQGGVKLLLDTYTGAEAAYSLRQLKSGVTNAIEVRRASDNTTQDIGFVDGELDTTSLASFCSGTDGFVTTWYDQSGNGNDATQTTASSQPQIVSSGSVITENSKPSVQFDGSDDYFPINNLYTLASGNDKIFNTFITTKVSNTAVSSFLSFGGSTTTPFYRITIRDNELEVLKRSDDSVIATNPANTAYSNVFSLITSLDSGTNLSTFINNINIDNNINFNVNNITFTHSTLGALVINNGGTIVHYLNGTMSELILYNTNQSSNRTGIETNINDFYSIYYVATNSEYQDVLDYADSQGYQRPSYAQCALQDALVGDLKDAGIWSKLDLLYVFATDGDSDFASINWKDPNNYEITEVNSPTFTSNQGFEGDGNSSYLNTNFVASTDSVKYTDADASFGIYANQAPRASNAFLTATRSGSDVNANYLRVSLSSINSNNTGNRDNFVTFYNFMQVQLISGTQYLYGNGNEITSKTFVGTPSVPTTSIYILAFNNNGTAQSFADSTIRSFYAGSSLLSESSDLNTALTTYYNAL